MSKDKLYRLQVYRATGSHSEYRVATEAIARKRGLKYFQVNNVYKVKCYYGFELIFEIV